jgi:excisionase family DNA binding protein
MSRKKYAKTRMPSSMTARRLSIADVARRLRLTPRTVRKMVSRGEFPAAPARLGRPAHNSRNPLLIRSSAVALHVMGRRMGARWEASFPQIDTTGDDLLTVAEVAETLGRSCRTVEKLVWSHDIAFTRVSPRGIRIFSSDLEAYQRHHHLPLAHIEGEAP